MALKWVVVRAMAGWRLPVERGWAAEEEEEEEEKEGARTIGRKYECQR